jgi:hypothetical protein
VCFKFWSKHARFDAQRERRFVDVENAVQSREVERYPAVKGH